MNKYQRIVLILGAIGLIVVIWTTPTVQYIGHGAIGKANMASGVANVLDLKTVIGRGIGIVGGTLFIWFALKDLDKSKGSPE